MDFTAVVSNSSQDDGCHINCDMETRLRGEFDVVAIVRLIMASLSILGASSIIVSAIYRKSVCNPKVHPIFVLSIVDTLLSVLWMSGAVVWLKGGLIHHHNLRVGCFTINCTTVILQCVAMNVTLIYALLAYSSIKERDFSGVYMIHVRQVSACVWPPLCSFAAYFIAWTLPVPLIMIPFGVIAQQYRILDKTNNCSCWCIPYYGNVLPHAQIGPQNQKEGNIYLDHLHYYITSYSMVLTANFIAVLCCMIVIYFKVFRRIKRMTLAQENNENTPLYGATKAVILAGQTDAKKRVSLFLAIYFITGMITLSFGLVNIVGVYASLGDNLYGDKKADYTLLLVEAIFVPLQGFMNALAYGWTRGDFLSVMSTQIQTPSQPQILATSCEAVKVEEEEEEDVDEREEWDSGSKLLSSRALGSKAGERKQR